MKTKEVRTGDSWLWLQKGELKRETESLIVAAQDHCNRKNKKTKIDKSQDDPL